MHEKRVISKSNRWLWGIFSIGLLLIAGGMLKYTITMGGMFTLTSQDEVNNVCKATAITSIVVSVYLIPTIFGRKKHNAAAIAVLRLYLGWTFIGWFVALIWASIKDKD